MIRRAVRHATRSRPGRTGMAAVGWIALAGCGEEPTAELPSEPVADTSAPDDTLATCEVEPRGIAGTTCIASTAPDWFVQPGPSYDVTVAGTVVAAGAGLAAPPGSTSPWGGCTGEDFGVQVEDAGGHVWTVGWSSGGALQPPTEAFAPGAAIEVRALYLPAGLSVVTDALALYVGGRLRFALEINGGLTREERGGIGFADEEVCQAGGQTFWHLLFESQADSLALLQGEQGTITSEGVELQLTVLAAWWWNECADGCGEYAFATWPTD